MCVPDMVRGFPAACEALGVKSTPFGFADYQRGATFIRNNREDDRGTRSGGRRREVADWVFAHNPDESGEYAFHANHSDIAVLAALARAAS